MSENERKLVDTAGDYRYAVKAGTVVEDSRWRSCRLVLTDERLVLANDDGKQTIPHAKMEVVDAEDVPPSVEGADGTPVRVGDNLLLFDLTDDTDFERAYCRATLHGEVILARTPAVVGGVVQEESGWRKARFRLDNDRVRLGFPDGSSTQFPIEDVGTVETDVREVMDEERTVVELEHTDSEGRSVETHLSGVDRHTTALQSLFEGVVSARADDYELSETENQVLMALYSGVSPFEMADFVGIDVDEVEAIYGKLLDIGAVDEVRTRTEVTLNAQGRNMASEAMSEQ